MCSPPATAAESQALWSRLCAREEGAYLQLETLVQKVCRPFLRKRGAPDFELEGLSSEVLISVWRYANPEREAPRNFASFLKYRALGVLSSHRASRSPQPLDPGASRLAELRASGVDPGEAFDLKHIARALEECTDELPVDHRDLWRARYESDRTLSELATQTRVKKSNLAVRLHRTRQRLQECLQRKGIL